MEFNAQCLNCQEWFTKVHKNGLCSDCFYLRECLNCHIKQRLVNKQTGLCPGCSAPNVVDRKMAASGETEFPL